MVSLGSVKGAPRPVNPGPHLPPAATARRSPAWARGRPPQAAGGCADTEKGPPARFALRTETRQGARLPTTRAVLTTTRSFYQVLVAVLRERLLLLVLVLGPAVGDHVVHDGRVVDGLRLAPRHLQRRLVQRLHLHVDGRGAAN